MLNRTLQYALIVAAALLVAACSIPLSAGADFDSNVDFTRYSTFTWDEADERPTGDVRLENNPFFTERLHSAIRRELESRGIRYDAEGPALVVHHHATVMDRVDVYEADRERGYDPSAYGPGTQVVQWEEGTFLVDIADRETRRVLWRGWAKCDIEAALNDSKRMTSLVNDAVALMFQRLPARLVPRPVR